MIKLDLNLTHFLLFYRWQIYTGPYRNPARRAQDVQENVDVDLLQEGDFVAVELENYCKRPVIGKVFEVNEDGSLSVTGRALIIKNGGHTHTSCTQRV